LSAKLEIASPSSLGLVCKPDANGQLTFGFEWCDSLHTSLSSFYAFPRIC
jgi:hypothetical protein